MLVFCNGVEHILTEKKVIFFCFLFTLLAALLPVVKWYDYLEYTQNHSEITPNTISEPKGVLPVTVGKAIQRLLSIYPGTIFSDIPLQMKQTVNSVH